MHWRSTKIIVYMVWVYTAKIHKKILLFLFSSLTLIMAFQGVLKMMKLQFRSSLLICLSTLYGAALIIAYTDRLISGFDPFLGLFMGGLLLTFLTFAFGVFCNRSSSMKVVAMAVVAALLAPSGFFTGLADSGLLLFNPILWMFGLETVQVAWSVDLISTASAATVEVYGLKQGISKFWLSLMIVVFGTVGTLSGMHWSHSSRS